MNVLESLKSNWQGLPKWAKWAVPIGAVAAVGYGIYRGKSSGETGGYNVSQPAMQSLDAAGMSKMSDAQILNNEQTQTASLGDLINQSISDQLATLFETTPTSPTDTSAYTFAGDTSQQINNQQTLTTDKITNSSDLAKQVPLVISVPVSPPLGYGGINYNTATPKEKQTIEAQTKLITTSPAYVQSETARTLDVISNRQAAGMDTTAQVSYLDKLVSTSGKEVLTSGQNITIQNAPLGVGGIDYNKATTEQKKAIEQNAQKIKTDSNYVQSEIDRTNKVIANRKSVGLSTVDQEKYLNTLNAAAKK